jgi:DNA-binding response OmpR family regulator
MNEPLSAQRSIEGTSVYLVDGKDESRAGLARALVAQGFRVSAFPGASDFYRAVIADSCDIAVIDVAVPGESGLAIASNLRRNSRNMHIGIVMLADPDAAETRLECFACGADAFVVRPIEVRELAAQLRAIRRRIADTRAPEVADGHGGWGLAEGGWVLRDPRGNELPLTTAQRAFVLRLIEAGDQPVSRLALISSLGSNPRDADPHRVDVLVSRLRQKASALGMTLPLHSVRGQGYVFTIDPGRSERAEPAWSAPRREAARTAATRWKTDDFEYRA